MQPTAAMAHTKLAGNSIPEPSEQSAAADANVRTVRRGRGARRRGMKGGQGEEEGEILAKAKPHLVSWFATGVCGCWNKDRQPSSASPPLKPPQPTRPVSQAWWQATHTHQNTYTCLGFCIFEREGEKKEWNRRRRLKEMINNWPIICSVTGLWEHDNMLAF